MALCTWVGMDGEFLEQDNSFRCYTVLHQLILTNATLFILFILVPYKLSLYSLYIIMRMYFDGTILHVRIYTMAIVKSGDLNSVGVFSPSLTLSPHVSPSQITRC